MFSFPGFYVDLPIMEVNIYDSVGGRPCFKSSLLELTRSRLLTDVIRSLSLCDLCKDPVSIIIDEEEKDTIISTFIRLSIQKESVTIIRGMD